ncbi:MAG: Asp-tRNA(Asn)/Glu-tRNA(Gln) amidotransferase subunit GatC [Acidobacteriota bacterium]
MKITIEEVERIARLAHLRFTAQERERLRGQLDQILAYVDKLRELDTRRVEPAVAMAAGKPRGLREDVRTETLSREAALANAPESGRGHFKVPKVIP